MGDHDLRLVDLLAALSVATDLGMGQEPEKAVRTCLVATAGWQVWSADRSTGSGTWPGRSPPARGAAGP